MPGLPPAQGIELRRMRRKTIAIHVYAERVEVRAPLKAPLRAIEAFLAEKRGWIERRQREMQGHARYRTRIYPGACLEIAGQAIGIDWQPARRPRAERQGDRLLLAHPRQDEAALQRLFLDWLAQEAGACLVPRARALAGQLDLATRLSGFRLRYTRSLWGRCSSRGEILFNPLVLLAPLPVIDYLVAHEVCHLQHMNHSAAFWQLVASVCPDWTASRRWLRQHAHRLQLAEPGSCV